MIKEKLAILEIEDGKNYIIGLEERPSMRELDEMRRGLDSAFPNSKFVLMYGIKTLKETESDA